MTSGIFIVGAPRSGTSMIAGTLAHPDFHMGTSLVSEDVYNPKGYYESPQVNEVNERMMKPLTYEFPSLLRRHLKGIGPVLRGVMFPFVTQEGYRMFAYTSEKKKIPPPSSENQASIRKILRERPFLHKDPRFCFTISHWRSFVPDSKVIVVFRDFRKTAKSMMEFVLDRNSSEMFSMTQRQALWIVRGMYERVLACYDDEGGTEGGARRWLFVHQEQVLDGTAFDRLEAFTERPLNRGFPDPSLTRSTPTQKQLSGPVRKTYRRLCALAGHESKGAPIEHRRG